jgi:hypothetical protein
MIIMAKRNIAPIDRELERIYRETRKAMRLTDKEIERMLRKTRKSFRFA